MRLHRHSIVPRLPSLPPLLLLLLLSAAPHIVSAQVRGDQSICDFYAAKNYGENNATTQLKLMQGIVAYAYAGGNSMPNGDKDSTGIFNPGVYQGQDVYLRPWFDGSKATSNNNDQPVNIQWLDGGGTTPLVAFMNGSTPTAEIQKGTNQYKLFTHWYYVFGKVYSCSRYKTFVENSFEPLNPAYVHKYMDLNQTHVGYFIDQLLVASKYYGFSDSDIHALSNSMNSKYNFRCLPPVDNSVTSICLAKECPVAAPSPNCAVYNNVKQRGVDAAAASTGGGSDATSLPSSSSSSSGSSGSSGSAGSSSSSSLSAGAIAGIVIASVAVLLMAVGMFLFFCRRTRQKTEAASASTPAPAPGPGFIATPPPAPMPTPSPAGFPPPQYGYAHNPHESYHSRQPTDSYISSYGPTSPSLGWVETKPRPEELGTYGPVSPAGMTSPSPYRPEMTQLAEMESPEPPSGWNSTNKTDKTTS
ncbi:hypothetical protein E4U21_001712 [Claviceps maximensis]|nr:hypothetical protein E4U21_001712 [Claviceps maximensis]